MKLPIDIFGWINEHRHDLVPPVGNKCLYKNDDFIIMVVGGPNERSDYHVNQTSEFFYQLEGEMVLDIQDGGVKKSIPISAGEVYLLGPEIPHRPRRMENSVGLVVEMKRKENQRDGLEWYCEECNHLLFQRRFKLINIEVDFKTHFDAYFSDPKNGTCPECDKANF